MTESISYYWMRAQRGYALAILVAAALSVSAGLVGCETTAEGVAECEDCVDGNPCTDDVCDPLGTPGPTGKLPCENVPRPGASCGFEGGLGVCGGELGSTCEAFPASDAGKIAFDSDRSVDISSGQHGDIFAISADGTGPIVNMTYDWKTDEDEPAWSPDGLQLAFDSEQADENVDIYTINLDGTGTALNVSRHPAGDDEPGWFPSGLQIAFDSDRDGDREIFIMSHEGENVTQLTFNEVLDSDPWVSTSGDKIVFRTDRDGNDEIYMMDIDGSNPVNLSNHPDADEEPCLSSDDSKIVFTRTSPDGNTDIYVMNADGSGQTRITEDPADDEEPVWSPDDTQIAFASERAGNFDIYVMDAGGENLTQITSHAADDEDPSWTE